MKLTGAQVDQLHNALLDGYTTDGLRQMVRVQLDERIETIAGGATLSAQVMSLIEWAETHDKTAGLIAAAQTGNPHNARLAQLHREAEGWFIPAATVATLAAQPPITEPPAQRREAMPRHRALVIGLAIASAVLMLLLSLLANLATTYVADALRPYAPWVFALLGVLFAASLGVLIWQLRIEAAAPSGARVAQRASDDSQIVKSPNRIAGGEDSTITQSAANRSRIEDSPNTIE